MTIVWLILAGLCLAAVLILAFDMIRFGRAKHKAEHPTSGKADAGGEIFLQGNKTYYRMPNGPIRKLADFRMDLRPGSVDMQEFTRLMEIARRHHEEEVKQAKIDAEKNMMEVAEAEAEARDAD